MAPHKYFLHTSHILPNLGSYKYFLYKPHKLSWALSQTLYLTYYLTWVFTKILITLLPKLGHKIILSPQKGPNSFTLWAKPKNPNKTLLQSPLLHSTLKSVVTQRPKVHYYTAPLKAHCYTALLLSPLLYGSIFTKSQKAQIIFWHLFIKPK